MGVPGAAVTRRDRQVRLVTSSQASALAGRILLDERAMLASLVSGVT